MTFNWITNGIQDPDQKRYCIELEYQLRPRITKFLMDNLEPDHDGDFSDFHFDVDLPRRQIRISDKTPATYVNQVVCQFMQEIGMDCC